MTLREFQIVNTLRCPLGFGYTVDSLSESDWALRVGAECGELLSNIVRRAQGKDIPLSECAFEMSDLLSYLVLLAERMGIDLETATIRKFNAVSRRRGSDVLLPDDGSPIERVPLHALRGADRPEE